MGKKKRKEMMINMMPLMMEGIDMNELMPKMMGNMLKDLSADDLIKFFKEALGEKETVKKLLQKIGEVNLMQKMMFKTYVSRFGFDETVDKLHQNALNNGWTIPDVRNLQQEYINSGIKEMTRLKILYFCNSQGGYSIIQNDEKKAMSVMMPMGVSVYEKKDRSVEIAAMNIGMMGGMFSGEVKEVLTDGGERLEASLREVIK
ncbi:MAG: DUF302 domain-containing protein [Candidatus Aminicenantes bacterium]|nr:DUF302 domain-containing protein [Candidatus Aminicenantes bacterium]